LEGLVYCPFCPFAAIVEDPTQQIFECLNCGVHSCRHCRVKSHHPLSCAGNAIRHQLDLIIAYRNENKLAAKHVVEEEMTKAFVRTCNNCKQVFLKEEGCNRIECTCGNLQCYVCSSNIDDYSHFDQINEDGRKCPLHGDTETLLKEQVAVAQERTVQKLLGEGTGLQDDDIRVDKTLNAYEPEIPEVPTPVLATQPQFQPAPPLFQPCIQYGVLRDWNDPVGHLCMPQLHLCVTCNKTFGAARSLSQHQKAKDHTNHRCAQCSKVFKSPDSLLQHQRDTNGSCAQGKRKRMRSQTSHPRKRRRV
jgi:hypothetical protein